MENLYSIYGIRCENAFHKMTLLQLIKNYTHLKKNIGKGEKESFSMNRDVN
jgi:hypothetical protein